MARGGKGGDCSWGESLAKCDDRLGGLVVKWREEGKAEIVPGVSLSQNVMTALVV